MGLGFIVGITISGGLGFYTSSGFRESKRVRSTQESELKGFSKEL